MGTDVFEIAATVIIGGLSVPIATWIKAKLPTDFPIQSVFIISALNFLAVWLLSLIPGITPEPLTMNAVLSYAMLGQITSQYYHAYKKQKENGATP